jgi:hypothetical protein
VTARAAGSRAGRRDRFRKEDVMSYIVYAEKIAFGEAGRLSHGLMKERFRGAVDIKNRLLSADRRIACFFIDPLLQSFEAANRFYFGILECDRIQKINAYKSGAGPIQALTDAKELIDHDLYDAVFIFGHEPLLSDTRKYGKDAVVKAMEIMEDYSLIRCYDLLAQRLCLETGLSQEDFCRLADKLYENYTRTFRGNSVSDGGVARGRILHDLGTDLFRLTDCANPNLDFAGGLIVASERVADRLDPSPEARVKVLASKYAMVEGSPQAIPGIVGVRGKLFAHMKEAFEQAQSEANISIHDALRRKNLLLEVYTCYPPIPMAFLLAAGFVEDVGRMPAFLDDFEITLTGGMNLAKAPWNNPALNGLIEVSKQLLSQNAEYGLVHGNGGIGEVQGVAVLGRQQRPRCDG